MLINVSIIEVGGVLDITSQKYIIFYLLQHSRGYNLYILGHIFTQFAKTRHNDAFLEIQILASVSSIYLKLCSVAIPMLYCKYFLSYKDRLQEKQHINFVRIPTAININYTIIIYEYFNIRNWGKDHSTQHEMAIPII